MKSETASRPSGHETAILLRQKYVRRRAAIQRFTERISKGNFPDDAEMKTLRDVGVTETEIRELVKLAAS